MKQDEVVREQLLALLRGGNAHMSFDQAVADFPMEQVNTQPPGLPYTPWRLLEHIRIAQRDILDFIRDPAYVSPEWPEGYWPSQGEEADETRWRQTIEGLRADRRELEKIVSNPDTDLSAPMPQGQKYTVLREILVAADHNAYHIGEFALMREAMGAWGKE
jgi:hypothetical protein